MRPAFSIAPKPDGLRDREEVELLVRDTACRSTSSRTLEDRPRGLRGPARLGAAALRHDHADRHLVAAARSRRARRRTARRRTRRGSSAAASSRAKSNVRAPSAPRRSRTATGVFETAIAPFGTWIVSCHGTLNDGSSKHGNARRASIASNWVKTYQSPPVLLPEDPFGVLGFDSARIGERQDPGTGRKISLKGEYGRSRCPPPTASAGNRLAARRRARGRRFARRAPSRSTRRVSDLSLQRNLDLYLSLECFLRRVQPQLRRVAHGATPAGRRSFGGVGGSAAGRRRARRGEKNRCEGQGGTFDFMARTLRWNSARARFR